MYIMATSEDVRCAGALVIECNSYSSYIRILHVYVITES
jgi:hypothetical protein